MYRLVPVAGILALILASCAGDAVNSDGIALSTRLWTSGTNAGPVSSQFGSGDDIWIHYSIVNVSDVPVGWSAVSSKLVDFLVLSSDRGIAASTLHEVSLPVAPEGTLASGDSLHREWMIPREDRGMLAPGIYSATAQPKVTIASGSTLQEQTIEIRVN